MRQSAFGEWYVTAADDDAGIVLAEAGEDIWAEIFEDEETPGMWAFEVKNNDDGETVLFSDSIFATAEAAREYLKTYVADVQLR